MLTLFWKCVWLWLFMMPQPQTIQWATPLHVEQALSQNPQDPFYYIIPISLNSKQQNALATQYIAHYFKPWHHIPIQAELEAIQSRILRAFANFEKKPGVGANTLPYPTNWLAQLQYNANLSQFPNKNVSGITVHNSYVRILPTLDPFYKHFGSLAEGYPFDDLQESFVAAGLPLRILHTSQDLAWAYVQTASVSGWIPSENIAVVSSAFSQNWQTGHYVVSQRDGVPLRSKSGWLYNARMGMLYPVVNSSLNQLQLLVVSQPLPLTAKLMKSWVATSDFKPFPVPLNQHNLATRLTQFMTKPYGWGGIYGYRDCSATTADLFGAFGIWLPRNSADQGHRDNAINLAGLKDTDKEALIIKKAAPFLTLIHLPGHIVLYLGAVNGHAMVFQNMWGLHVFPWPGSQNRIVVGRTVITPLDFGRPFINRTLSPLHAADSMTILVNTAT